jgi:hypothetical protein
VSAPDPFSAEADPYPPARVGRRDAARALAVLPLLASAMSGCAHRPPACPTRASDADHCRHRFCRYYGSR